MKIRILSGRVVRVQGLEIGIKGSRPAYPFCIGHVPSIRGSQAARTSGPARASSRPGTQYANIPTYQPAIPFSRLEIQALRPRVNKIA